MGHETHRLVLCVPNAETGLCPTPTTISGFLAGSRHRHDCNFAANETKIGNLSNFPTVGYQPTTSGGSACGNLFDLSTRPSSTTKTNVEQNKTSGRSK